MAGWVPVAPAAEAMPVGVVGPTEAPLLTEVVGTGAVAAGVLDGFVSDEVGVVGEVVGILGEAI